MEEELKEYKVISVMKVQWGDMDAYQHVNNVVYVRWGENARIDYLHALEEFSLASGKIDLSPILAFQSVKYISPLVYPDTIFIGTKTDEIKEDRIVLKSFYYSEKQQKLVAIKTHDVVLFDYQKQRKMLVPDELIQLINEFEQR
ncbi:acyl-CoA thioesterase [Flavobacterium aestivum]|uniref:acyl-CoA thioesterase n=1 Tax=Flavobacterium aestivum TaxID=3003257 RepID=UPI002285E9FF|nr:thioesterase family protein [Flavobacterium aestivum]